MFGLGTNHETRNVLNEQQWCLMSSASFNEIRDLLCGLGIDNAAKPRRSTTGLANHPAMVGNYCNLNTANTRMSCDHLFCIVRLKLIEMTVVEQTLQ